MEGNAFFKGVIKLTKGSAIAQLILILSTPILTRLYTPEQFGNLAVFTSFISIISVVATFRYHLAIPIQRFEGRSVQLVYLSSFLALLVSILVFLILFFFKTDIFGFAGVYHLQDYYWIIPFGILASALYQVYSFYNSRIKNFSLISSVKVKQSIFSVIIQVGFFFFGTIALLLGSIVGQSAGLYSLYKKFKAQSNYRINYLKILALARRFKNFPIYSTWGALSNTGGRYFPALIISANYSLASAGAFFITNKLLTLPVSVVSASISQVLLSYGKGGIEDNTFANNVNMLVLKLSLISMPITFFINHSSPIIFVKILGEDWSLAGSICSLLSVVLLTQFLTSSVSQVFTILEKQRLSAILNSLILLMKVIALTFGSFFLDFIDTILLFSVSTSLGYFVFIIFIFISLELSVVKLIVRNVFLVIVCYILFSVNYMFELDGITSILLSLLSLLFCYFIFYILWRYNVNKGLQLFSPT